MTSSRWLRAVMLVLIASHFSLDAAAQEAQEYRMEIGGGVGVINYLGDYNGNLLKNLQPMGTAIAKYRPNPRMAWTLGVSYGKLKGNIGDADTWMPEAEKLPQSFSNGVVDGTVRFEYNFWPYGTGREYYGARHLTPFIALGLGLTYADTPEGGVTAMNMPLGAGVKYKVAERLNLTAEWRLHFTNSDRLDGVSDPYTVRSSGLFKNTDCYSILQLSLTYDIWAKCKTCNNDRD